MHVVKDVFNYQMLSFSVFLSYRNLTTIAILTRFIINYSHLFDLFTLQVCAVYAKYSFSGSSQNWSTHP